MTYYIIETVYTATDSNPNFKGETHYSYTGKGGKSIDYTKNERRKEFSLYEAQKGYARLCDAKRSYNYKSTHELDTFWNVESHILTVLK